MSAEPEPDPELKRNNIIPADLSEPKAAPFAAIAAEESGQELGRERHLVVDFGVNSTTRLGHRESTDISCKPNVKNSYTV